MEASVLSRLEQLRGEHAIGVRRLEELSREFDVTRETVVRISGAIQVLEELLSDAPAPEPAGGPGTELPPGPGVLPGVDVSSVGGG